MKEFYKNKKILITGHTGYKGSWLSKILVNMGADVLGYALESKMDPSLFHFLNLENEMKSVIGNMNDFEKLNQVVNDFQPDIVFHLAAVAQVGDANNNPKEAYNTNTIGILNLLESIRNCDSVKSFVNVSTDAVYLNTSNYYKEDDIISGNNSYGNSKSCAELIVSNYKKMYLNHVSMSNTRCVNIIGGGDFNKGRIMSDCVNSFINNQDIKIKSPNNIRPFLHVLEALYGYLLLAQKQYNDSFFEGTYNFSPLDEDYVMIKDIVNIYCDKVGNKIKWVDISNSDIKYQKNVIDSTKARNILVWKSIYNIEERVELITEWTNAYLNNEDITNIQIEDFFDKIKGN